MPAPRIRGDSASIHYEVAGSGPPLLLIHGLSASGRWWARNVDAFAAHFRVYTVDLVGFGASHRLGRFVLDDAAAGLVGWMDRVGVERADVAGHSLGGYVAADLAARFPERVRRLILVDAAVLPLGGAGRYALGMLLQARYTSLGFLPTLARDVLRAGPATTWQASRAIVSADLGPRLERIGAPTLAIWGEHDTVVPLEIGHEIARRLPHARLVVIPGAGHNLIWDSAQAFNQEVLQFLLAP